GAVAVVRRLALVVALGACHRHEPAACTAPPAPESGDGTYYAADGTGSCSFEAGDRMVAAMNGPDWASAAWCGACLEVTSGNAHVVVRVVDKCPGCKHGDLDLSEAAFAVLVTDARGHVLGDEAVQMAASTTAAGAAQFPACP